MGNNTINNHFLTQNNGSGLGSGQEFLSRNQNTFAFRLKSRREKLKITQLNLANFVGVTKNAYQTWELSTNPSSKYISKLAEKLKCSTDWLLIGDVPEPPDVKKQIDKPGPLYNKVEPFDMRVAAPGVDGVSQDKKEYDPHGGWEPMDVHEFTGVDKGLGFGRAVERLAKIYGSKMPSLINAISVNLEAFCEAVDRREGEAEAVAQVEKLNLRVDTLEKQLKSLFNNKRRESERRRQDLGPPDGLERRTGTDRRRLAAGD